MVGESPGLRAAIAGGGMIAAVHARAIQRSGGRLVGVSASTAARAAEVAQELGAERAFRDNDELLASDADVIHVCTPNRLHFELARDALAAGKHVICEKPLAVDRRSAEELVAAAEDSGAVAATPFIYRYYPMVREARDRVARGRIGRLTLVHGAYLQDWLFSAADNNWRVDPAHGGPSRVFADIGSHWCDLVEFVTGQRIQALSAQLRTVVPERSPLGPGSTTFSRAPSDPDGDRVPVSTEDVAAVMFRLETDVIGSVVLSQVSPGHKNGLTFEISGTEGGLGFDQQAPDVLRLNERDGVKLLDRDPSVLSDAAAAQVLLPAGHPQGYQDCFDAFVADAYAAASAGAGAPDGMPTFADGARAVGLAEAVLRSAESGGWATVDGDTGAS
jgi:predicted dehydrogenase